MLAKASESDKRLGGWLLQQANIEFVFGIFKIPIEFSVYFNFVIGCRIVVYRTVDRMPVTTA